MYYYNSDFLFNTSIPNITSIKFRKSKQLSYYLDPNTRCFIVEYVDRMKYNQIKYNGFSRTSNNDIVDGEYKLMASRIVINGINYKFTKNIKFISCIIIDGTKLDIQSHLLNRHNSIYIVLNSSEIENWDINNYIELVNGSVDVIAEVIDKSKFSFSNFESIDLKYSIDDVFNNTDYRYQDWKFYIDESDIVSEYIKFMETEFPTYDIFHGVTDASTQKQKTRILVYTPKLADGQSEFATRIIKHAVYGKLIQVKIQVGWEFITDDFKEYINFKNKLTLNHEMFSKTKFKFSKDNSDWWYTINWLPEVGSDIERTPQAKVLSDTLLYSMPFSCELIGWLVLDNVDYPTILYPISRTYIDAWKLIRSAYDDSDPNVKFRLVINSIENGFIFKETEDGKIYLTNLDIDNLGDKNYIIKIIDGFPKVYDIYGNEVNDIKFEVTSEEISPIDLDHGEYILSGSTEVFTPENEIVSIERTTSGKLKYIINLNNYLNSTEQFRK